LVEACEVINDRSSGRKISCFSEGTMEYEHYLSRQNHEEDEEEDLEE
jgi:hypothetical protein